MRYLKQSTSVDVPIGPFLDETDGKTAETALTITQPDVRLKKNNGNWAQKAAAQTLTHEEAGWYEVTLDATDTDTIGHLVVAVHESGALPVWMDFHVLAANVYDSLFGAATDKLEVDAREFGGTAGTFSSGRPEVNTTHVAGTSQTAGDICGKIGTPSNLGGGATVAANLSDIEGQTDDIGAAGAGLTAVPWNAAWDAEVQSEVADALDAAVPVSPTANSINERIKTMDDADIPARLPAALVSGRMDSSVGAYASGLTPLQPTVAGRTLDVTATGEAGVDLDNTAGTLAKGTDLTGFNDLSAADVRAAVGLASANLDTQLAALLALIDTEVAAILAAVDTEVAAIKAKTDNLPASPAAVGSAMTLATDAVSADALSAAAVSEIVAGILAGTITEISAVPAASPTLTQLLSLLFLAVRNKVTVSATQKKFHTDAGAVLATKALSDDGSTYTEDEAA